MKFNFWVDGSYTFLEAILEAGDYHKTNRQEGSCPPIQLRTNLVYFDYPVQSIHPDLLAGICLVIFHPFMGKSVTFPRAVSPRLANNLGSPGILRGLPRQQSVQVRNVNPHLPPYRGDRPAIAFGGGMDSTSLRALFPEVYLVQEAHLRNGQVVPDRTSDVIKPLVAQGRAKTIRSNLRYITEPGGWTAWTSKLATSLLVTTDFKFGAIYTGDILGAAFIEGGVQFVDRYEKQKHYGIAGNSWQSLFYGLGLPFFSPISGVSEVASTQISFGTFPIDQITWCTADHGRPCERCIKCLRRAVIRAALGIETQQNWDRYASPRNLELLKPRPLYMGHIYAYCVPKIANAPAWLRATAAGLPIPDWVTRYYPESFDFMPEAHRDVVRTALDRYLEPMSDRDMAALKTWRSDPAAFTTAQLVPIAPPSTHPAPTSPRGTS